MSKNTVLVLNLAVTTVTAVF